MSLPQLVIKRPVLILMLFLAIMLIGIISLTRLPVELLPDTSPSKITIITNVRGGIPPVEIENSVTRLIEEGVSDVSNLQEIVSTSKEGRSVVVVRFEAGSNMDFAAMEIRERYDRIKNKLPREVERPVIAKYEESDEPIIILAFTSQRYSTEFLRKIVDEEIKGQLEKVSGVANIEVYGGRERKILVEVSQPRLQAISMPLRHVVNMLGASNLNILAGEIKRHREKSLIRTMGELKNISDIGNLGIAISLNGNIVRLNDIARIEDSYLEARNIARVNERPMVTLYIQKESGANTIKVAALIKEQLEIIKGKVDKSIEISYISDQADFIKAAIKNVRNALVLGAILSSLCLWLFLRNARATLVIAFSIPLSVIATFSLMYLRGITLNIMTLSGLALGVGMLVDNSIVVIENIVRKNEKGIELISAVVSGSEEVLLAIVASTFTTVVVFSPLVFVSKNIQILYSGSALTIVFSLLASLVVAILLIPMLASKFKITGIRENKRNKLKKIYRKFFMFVFRHRFKCIAVIFGIFILSVILFTRLDKEFISPFEEGRFTIFAKMEAGAKLSLIDDMSKEVENVVNSVPEVRTITSHIEGWSTRVYVTLVPLYQRKRSAEDIINRLRPELKEIEQKYKGGFIYFSEAQEAATAREVVVDIFGYDYDVIDKLVSEVGGRISEIEGMVDIKRSIEEGRPELRLMVDREKAALFGFSVGEIADILHAQIRGLRATYYRTEGNEVEIIVQLDEKYRDTLEKIKKLTLIGSEGQQVYLDQLCSFTFGIGPAEIWRKNKKRMIQLSATSTKFSLDKVTKRLKNTLSTISFPKDYFYKFGGTCEIMQKNRTELMFALVLTLLLVYMIMASLYESYYKPFIIMFTVPLAMIGVVTALTLTRKPVNVGVAIGAMVLGGIVVNNAIILVDHIGLMRKKNLSIFRAVISASQDRLRPILITSFTTIFGMMPLAFSKSEGSSLWAPLGITVVSGMISSTFLTLFIVPIIYVFFENIIVGFKKRYKN
ncbi:MAG: efflux RND transporter permease subunit [Candidatus Omnitrophota bacterium]